MLVEQPLAVFVNSVDLENLFCQIDADSLNVHDGRSAQVVTIYRPTVAQDVGGDHSINKARAIMMVAVIWLHPVTTSAVKSIRLSAMTSSNMITMMFIMVTRIGKFFKAPMRCFL
ncbi:hypothetical protein ZE78_05305 [Salmonella enterica subsp. enterica serovar Newport]|nr:hypothetical protein [Salmonella enterica subsp. enterica serovar Newport]